MNNTPEMWPHQKATVSFFSTCHRGNDWSDPGTGKTRAQIELYAKRQSPGRMLVVCPLTLMRSAWGNDFNQFAPGIHYSIADARHREEAFAAKTDVVLINSDGVKWLAKQGTKYLRGFDHLVIDEATAFKHRTSQRSKAMASLRNRFEYRYAMTGTPNSNSITDLWNQMLIIDDGERLGTSFTRFRSASQTPVQVGPLPAHIAWKDKPGIAAVVDALLRDITVRHAFEDVMQHIPANYQETKTYTLNAKAQATYEQMRTEAAAVIENHVLSVPHAAALSTKLLQIASGAVYSGTADGSDGGYYVVDRGRYEFIADLIAERDHSITFFNWRHQRDELCNELDKRDLSFAVIDGATSHAERDAIVEKYQGGAYRTLLLHPRTGAHGLTLTRGVTTIISSPIYEADLLKQAIHRIYRGGQTQRTNTVLICAENTLEKAVYEKLQVKYSNMNDLLTLINAR